MNASMLWLIAAAICGVAGVALAVVVPRAALPRVVAWGGSAVAAALGGCGVSALAAAGTATHTLWILRSVGPVVVQCDRLSGLFLLVTGVVAIPASIFAAGAMTEDAMRISWRGYAVMHLALIASLGWIFVAADVFSFFVAWEIMAILCYLLVVYQHADPATADAGYLMLGLSEVGALAAIGGLLIAAAHAGSLSFADLRGAAVNMPPGARLAVFLLTFAGFAVKGGLVPANAWLAPAYRAAPTCFAPLLAGATLNAGLYGIIRVVIDLVPPASVAPGLIALIVGSLSALIGILYATTADDLKEVLAHSSTENAGIVIVSIGAGMVFAAAAHPALAAVAMLVGLYHLVNHSVYKTLLFIGSGAVESRAGGRSLDRLGGLIRRMPWTSAAVLVGVLAITALPPLNGFVSEWLTMQTLLRSAELGAPGVRITFALSGAVIALTAALAVTCFAKMFAMGFLGTARSEDADRASEASRLTLVPMGILAAACCLLGVLPTYVIGVLGRVVSPFTGHGPAAELVPPFFPGAAGHDSLPAPFAAEFHDLGAGIGHGIVPGPGLVILHRGGSENPVVFAASPSYLFVVLVLALALLYGAVRYGIARHRAVVRRGCWDGGVRRLLPEMTYTATGFSNPVRVIFHAVFRPTVVEDSQEAVAEHFRIAIRREAREEHPAQRIVVAPARRLALALARSLARMHHGRLNAYLGYVLGSLLVACILAALVIAAG